MIHALLSPVIRSDPLPGVLLGLATSWLCGALLYRLWWHRRFGAVFGTRLAGIVQEIEKTRLLLRHGKRRTWVAVDPQIPLPPVGARITVDGTVDSVRRDREQLYRQPVAEPAFVALRLWRGRWPRARFLTRAACVAWLIAAGLLLHADRRAINPFVGLDLGRVALERDRSPLPAPPARPTPQVRMGHVQVRGELDPRVARGIVRRHLHYLAYCYVRTVSPDEGTTQTVMDVVVDYYGDVIKVELEWLTKGDLRFERCLQDTARGWRFPPPPPKSAARVSIPLNFYWTRPGRAWEEQSVPLASRSLPRRRVSGVLSSR